MSTIPLTPELQVQLEARDAAFVNEVAAIQRGYDDVKAGRTVSLEDFDQHMRRKYELPR